MDASLLHIASSLGQALLVAAITFVLVVLLTSHLRFQALARSALEAEQTVGGEGEAFQVQVAHRLGTAHRDPAPFCLILMKPRDAAGLREQFGAELVVEFLDLVEARLRGVIRSVDSMLRYGEDRLALIIEVRLSGIQAVLDHLQEEMRRELFRTRNETVLRPDLLVAVAAYPKDGDKAHVLHGRLREALDRAEAGAPSPVYATLPDADAVEDKAAHDQKDLVDELTGVLREDRIGTAMQKFVARYRKEDLPVSLVSIDIDYLRRYNEQYGRKAGDLILKQIAAFLQNSLRESDLIARLGGDQFLLALPCKASEALAVAQRLSVGVKRQSFPIAGANLKLTVSAGVASAPDHGSTARQLFSAATEALQVAKARGRSSCMLYDDKMQRPTESQAQADIF